MRIKHCRCQSPKRCRWAKHSFDDWHHCKCRIVLRYGGSAVSYSVISLVYRFFLLLYVLSAQNISSSFFLLFYILTFPLFGWTSVLSFFQSHVSAGYQSRERIVFFLSWFFFVLLCFLHIYFVFFFVLFLMIFIHRWVQTR